MQPAIIETPAHPSRRITIVPETMTPEAMAQSLAAKLQCAAPDTQVEEALTELYDWAKEGLSGVSPRWVQQLGEVRSADDTITWTLALLLFVDECLDLADTYSRSIPVWIQEQNALLTEARLQTRPRGALVSLLDAVRDDIKVRSATILATAENALLAWELCAAEAQQLLSTLGQSATRAQQAHAIKTAHKARKLAVNSTTSLNEDLTYLNRKIEQFKSITL